MPLRGSTGWVAEQQGLTVVNDESRVQIRRGVGVHSVDAFEIIFLLELLRNCIPKIISGLPFSSKLMVDGNDFATVDQLKI